MTNATSYFYKSPCPPPSTQSKIIAGEKGLVLVVSLMLMTILTLLGSTAVLTSTTDLTIGANYKAGNRAMYAAEAGVEEARGRLRANAGTSVVINDGQPTNTNWRAFIGSSTNAQKKGYSSGNGNHVLYAGLQSNLTYTVKIQHQTNAGGSLLYWGDPNGDGVNERNTATGQNIYLATSYGLAAKASRQLAVEITRVPPINAPSALYVEAPTSIQGASTNVIGGDQCGGADKPGIVTTLSTSTVTSSGGPTVSGTTSSSWSVVGGGTNMDVQAMIDSQKGSANYTYNVASATHTGMSWGMPTLGVTLQSPSTCGTTNVVYYNTSNGTNLTDIKLSGGSTGCGTLIVEGDLEINGGFYWYGIILVSGSVTYSGGGNKNVTGAVLAGGSVDADLVGGNANIVYCSSAISNQTENQPLRRLSWTDRF